MKHPNQLQGLGVLDPKPRQAKLNGSPKAASDTRGVLDEYMGVNGMRALQFHAEQILGEQFILDVNMALY